MDAALWSNTLTISYKEVKYRAYAARYRQFDGFGYVNVYFRYHDPLPETAVLRITQIDEQTGSFGEASIGLAHLKDGPDDLLGALICSSAVSPAMSALQLECIDTATDELIFTVAFTHRGTGGKSSGGQGSGSSSGSEVLPNGQPADGPYLTPQPVTTPWVWGQQATPDPFDWIKNPISTPDPYGGGFYW